MDEDGAEGEEGNGGDGEGEGERVREEEEPCVRVDRRTGTHVFVSALLFADCVIGGSEG